MARIGSYVKLESPTKQILTPKELDLPLIPLYIYIYNKLYLIF